jgi:hypothetical protein
MPATANDSEDGIELTGAAAVQRGVKAVAVPEWLVMRSVGGSQRLVEAAESPASRSVQVAENK